MTNVSSEINLNIAVLPVVKKKAKSKTTAHSFSKFNEPTVTKTKEVKSVKSNLCPKISVQNSNEVPGVLKKPKPASSIWKKFKQANKKECILQPSFVKPINKPVRLVKKKVKVKDNPEIILPLDVHVNNPHKEPKKPFEEFDVNKKACDTQILEKKKKNFNSRKEELNFHESDKINVKFNKQKAKTGFFNDYVKLQDNLVISKNPKNNRLSAGKTTSLFLNNPEVPNIPHRAVKQIKETVFSNSNFEDMKLHPYMVKYLKESLGLTKMTTVQEKSIPVLLNKQDALIKSQTGSGKTFAFALPILHKLQEIRPKITRADGVLVLIIVPTRELALQVYEVFNKLVKSYTWIVPGYLVGGEKRKSEKARLKKGITILIGTPGRLIDHVRHTKALNLEKVSWLVIDEADRLLDMGYEKDVSFLLDALNQNKSSLLRPSYLSLEEGPKKEEKPTERQTVLLSATLTQKVEKLAGLSLKNPVFVDACDENVDSPGHVPVFSDDTWNEIDTVVLPETLVQKYIITPPKLKLVTLASFILWKIKLTKQKKMLIFIATQDMVDFYTELLSSIFLPANEEYSDEEDSSPFSNSGIALFKLHGNMKQNERTEVFKTFRKSHLGILLCTDVASRGLDLPEVDWVIQYTGPTSVSDYVHRVGRTARGGQPGSSIIFLTPNEVSFIGKLENCQIRLQEEKLENCLNHLFTIRPQGRSMQEEATKLQLTFENMVAQKEQLYDLGCKAFTSWSRFYASYPRNMRDVFSVKTIHQGHYAKSFALRDPPSVIINYAKKKNLNEERFARKRPRERKESEKRKGFTEKTRISEVSEFDSGLEPVHKKRKK